MRKDLARAKGRRFIRPILIILCALFLGCREMAQPLDLQPSGGGVASETPVLVRTAACWSAVPLVEEIVRLHGDEGGRISFDLVPGNSRNTLDRVTSGRADLAIVCGEPDADALTRSGDTRFETRTVALDAVAIIGARNASLESLSSDELAGLLVGRYVDWRELGAGNGAPELVSREDGAATRVAVEQLLLGQRLASTALILPHDRAIVDYVAEHREAIGYVSAALVDDRVKMIPIDGVKPSDRSIGDGSYPLVLPLVAVVPSSGPRLVAGLVELMQSSRGRSAIDGLYTLPR